MMPLGEVYEKNFEQAYDAIRSYFHERGRKLCFSRITRDELTYFRNRVADDASIVYDRDNSDYLYLTKDLIELRGKKYDGKRNHINRFKREHTFEYVPLECSLLDECTRIMEEWCRDKDCQCQEGITVSAAPISRS